MHEMAITQSVLDISLKAAEDAGATRIRKVRILMGEYSDVVPVVFREYFKIAAQGTAAEDAEIELKRVPVTVVCRQCGFSGHVDKRHIQCPECGSRDLRMTGGREFMVESLEAD